MSKKTEKEKREANNYFFEWNLWIKLFWRIVLLGSGIIIGLAGGIYWQREICLDAVFQNSTETLTNEEINRILQTLNEPNDNSQTAVANELSENSDSDNSNSLNNNNNQNEKKFVGSRNSQKFYSVDCRFAKKIKEENKVWFSSLEEGEKAGKMYLECN